MADNQKLGIEVKIFCEEGEKEELKESFERLTKYVLGNNLNIHFYVFCENSGEGKHGEFLNQILGRGEKEKEKEKFILFLQILEPEIPGTGIFLKEILRENWAEYKLCRNQNIVKILKVFLPSPKER